MNVRNILLMVVFLLSGCGSTTFTSAGGSHAVRPTTCDFQVFTSGAPSNAQELGTIDVTLAAGHTFPDLADFKAEIRPYVCRAGGDAVVATANGNGWWIKASVLLLAPAAPAGGLVEASRDCTPPCSPGYECNSGTCAALCNPACPAGWVCGPDRTCRGPGQ